MAQHIESFTTGPRSAQLEAIDAHRCERAVSATHALEAFDQQLKDLRAHIPTGHEAVGASTDLVKLVHAACEDMKTQCEARVEVLTQEVRAEIQQQYDALTQVVALVHEVNRGVTARRINTSDSIGEISGTANGALLETRLKVLEDQCEEFRAHGKGVNEQLASFCTEPLMEEFVRKQLRQTYDVQEQLVLERFHLMEGMVGKELETLRLLLNDLTKKAPMQSEDPVQESKQQEQKHKGAFREDKVGGMKWTDINARSCSPQPPTANQSLVRSNRNTLPGMANWRLIAGMPPPNQRRTMASSPSPGRPASVIVSSNVSAPSAFSAASGPVRRERPGMSSRSPSPTRVQL